MKSFSTSLVLSVLAGMAVARTDLSGCTSSATVNQYNEASMIWYVPGTGEICSFPDCGGGRAPPKYDQPGCPLYTGTATLTPSYLPGYGPGAKPTATGPTATPAAPATNPTAPGVTNAPSMSSGCTGSTKTLTFKTKCSKCTKAMSSSRPLITPGPSMPVGSSTPASSVPVATGPVETSGPAGPPTIPVTHNAAAVPGLSVGAVLAIAAAVGMVL